MQSLHRHDRCGRINSQSTDIHHFRRSSQPQRQESYDSRHPLCSHDNPPDDMPGRHQKCRIPAILRCNGRDRLHFPTYEQIMAIREFRHDFKGIKMDMDSGMYIHRVSDNDRTYSILVLRDLPEIFHSDKPYGRTACYFDHPGSTCRNYTSFTGDLP